MTDYKEFADMERDGWSEPETAKAYASGFASATAQCVPALVAAIGAGEGMHVLDLCCGHGVVSQGLLGAGAKVTGLDFSPAMLALARAKVPGVDFVEGNAASLSYADNSFDGATMGFGILHIPNSTEALAEVKRVLKPGAHFSYSVWHGPEISAAFRIVFGAIAKHGDPTIVLPPGPAIHEYADEEFAFAALKEAGFSEPKRETVESYWQGDDAGQPVDHFKEGTVRGAALLRAQPPENLRNIRAAVEEMVKHELGPTGPWRIGIPAAVVSAVA